MICLKEPDVIEMLFQSQLGLVPQYFGDNLEVH